MLPPTLPLCSPSLARAPSSTWQYGILFKKIILQIRNHSSPHRTLDLCEGWEATETYPSCGRGLNGVLCAYVYCAGRAGGGAVHHGPFASCCSPLLGGGRKKVFNHWWTGDKRRGDAGIVAVLIVQSCAQPLKVAAERADRLGAARLFRFFVWYGLFGREDRLVHSA